MSNVLGLAALNVMRCIWIHFIFLSLVISRFRTFVLRSLKSKAIFVISMTSYGLAIRAPSMMVASCVVSYTVRLSMQFLWWNAYNRFH